MSPDDSVMIHFDRCAPYLERAIAYSDGDYTLEEVRERCESGEFQFWPGRQGCVVTMLATYPRTKACISLFTAGDDPDELVAIYKCIMAWAKSIGCSRLTGYGRPGWARHRLTRETGFKPKNAVIMEVSLDG